jgi:hypothetical protein
MQSGADLVRPFPCAARCGSGPQYAAGCAPCVPKLAVPSIPGAATLRVSPFEDASLRLVSPQHGFRANCPAGLGHPAAVELVVEGRFELPRACAASLVETYVRGKVEGADRAGLPAGQPGGTVIVILIGPSWLLPAGIGCGSVLPSWSQPAGDIQGCPRHVGRVVRQQPEYGCGDVRGVAHPRERYLGYGPVQMLLGLAEA